MSAPWASCSRGASGKTVGPGSALSTPTLPCRGQDVLHPGGPCGQRALPSYGRLKGPREVGPRPLPLTLGGLRGEDRRTGKASESEGSHARTQPRTLPRSPSLAPSCETECEAKKQSPRSPGVACRLWVSVFMSQLPGEEGMGACGASTRLAPRETPGGTGRAPTGPASRGRGASPWWLQRVRAAGRKGAGGRLRRWPCSYYKVSETAAPHGDL